MINEEIIGILFALLAAICWGLGASLYKAVIKSEHSLFLTIVIRGSIAVPFIAFVTFFVNGFTSLVILLSPELLPILFFSSIFVGFGDLWFFGSLQRIDITKAMPVASMYPLFTAILLVIFGLEMISYFVIIGIIILIAGLGFLAQEYNSQTTSVTREDLKAGLALAVLAAIFWSLGIYTLRIILDFPEVDVYSLATVRFGLLSFLFVILWSINTVYRYQKGIEDPASLSQMSKKISVVLGLGGIFSWGIGAISFFSSIELIGAARATPISSVNPLISVIIGIFFLKEKLSRFQAIGILLIIFGSIFISIQQI
ncbi:MAG: GRP family sugar transporter [Promethearchaeota archaeon]